MASGMDSLGTNFNAAGATMTRREVEDQRKKRGKCLTCGQQCFERRMFKSIPLTINGLVDKGRCLTCKPLAADTANAVLPAAVRPATQQDYHRMNVSSQSLSSRSIGSSSGVGHGYAGAAGGVNPLANVNSMAAAKVAAGILKSKYGQGKSRSVASRVPAPSPAHTPRSIPKLQKADSNRSATGENSRRNLMTRDLSTQSNCSAVSNVTEGCDDVAPAIDSRPSLQHNNSHASVNATNQSNEVPLVNEDTILANMNHQNYRELFSVIKERSASANVAATCLRSLSRLALSPTDVSIIESKHSGSQLILNSMNSFKDNETIQEYGCHVLWSLSTTETIQIVIHNHGGITTIASAMEHFPNSPRIQEEGIMALCNIGLPPQTHSTLLQTHAMEKIVTAMNTHLEDIDLQEQACTALANLSTRSKELYDAIIQADGINAIVVVMMIHHQDPDLQQISLRGLRNLCASSDANKVLVANAGGIDNVIRAMQDHRDVPAVQEQGCWTLSNLAVNANNKVYIGTLGGIDVIVRAIWVHMENAAVLEWAFRALWTLSVDATNKEQVIQVGGITAISQGMRAHPKAHAVQEKGCGVLGNMAANSDENKLKIVQEEGLEVIILAMSLHRENKMVQDRACGALRRLSCAQNIPVMQASGVAEALTYAVEMFPDQCKDKAEYIINML